MDVSVQAKLLRAIEEGEIERLGGTKPIPLKQENQMQKGCRAASGALVYQ
jgi:hypothetical protein